MHKNSFIISLTAIVIVYCIGAFAIPLMDVDAAQYASISREMLEKQSYLQLFDLNADYLDKPPMLFWLSALSMKIFGIYDWAYRIPSLLFLGIALFATFHFAKLYYNITTARLASLILASSQAFFLISHDVRTDTMLVGWVMAAICAIAYWTVKKQNKYFFIAAIAIAGGMMTKGPIALVVPILCFAPEWFCKKDWAYFFKPIYLLGIVIIALFLFPMTWGLYQQFDLHPGKIINHRPIQSGVEFYYWTQSFGRYTGENAYKEMGYFTFLLENMFWSFLPWIFVFLWALITKFINIIKEGVFRPSTERISFFGFVLTYLVLSRSQAQLPHYIFVVFPLAAILTAAHWEKMLWSNTSVSKPVKFLSRFHFFLMLVFVLVVGLILTIPFGLAPNILILTFFILLFLILKMFLSNYSLGQKWFYNSILLWFGVNLVMNLHFYPNLLPFQLGNQLVKQINQQHWDKEKIVLHKIPNSYALHFYGKHIFKIQEDSLQLKEGDWVVTDFKNDSIIKEQFPNSQQRFASRRFHVTMLSLPFLNPAKRDQETIPFEIVELKK
jgi:4-amino-4-deoxy-L-arabinose transferase-like glycosyltransferase